MTVICAALAAGATIPGQYTGTGRDVSPPLSWSAPPEGTRSLAVVCHDPDAPAGDWSHWLLFNLPPETLRLPEGVSPVPRLPDGAVQGVNDFGRHGYGGPMPPRGQRHRYRYEVFALDRRLELGPSARLADLRRAMEGHVLGAGVWTGVFER